MVAIEHSDIDNEFMVDNGETKIKCRIVDKPFYDPKKTIASS